MLSKAYPEERVGVFARKNGRVEVVEYSELDPKEAAATFDSEPLPERFGVTACPAISVDELDGCPE